MAILKSRTSSSLGLDRTVVPAAGQNSKIGFYVLGVIVKTVKLLWPSFQGSPPSDLWPDLGGGNYFSSILGSPARLR